MSTRDSETGPWVNTSKHGANEHRVLHSDPDCMFVTEESVPPEEANVDPDDLKPCDYCAGKVHGKTITKDCPYCGATVNDLPDHLPCEESP